MSPPVAFDSHGILSEALEIAAIAAPPFGEGARAEHVLRLVRKLPGWTVRRDDVGNVIASPRGAEPEGAVWVLVHLDTVFGGSTELSFSTSHGVAIGPGIGDNAVALASALAVMRAFGIADGGPRKLFVGFTVGEEAQGNLRGAKHLLESERAKEASAVLAVEGHRGDELGTVMVGSARFRLTVTRPGGHSWWDRGKPSAVHDLIEFGHRLLATTARDLRAITLNIGTFRGGTGITALAPEASIEFEGRSPSTAAIAEFAAAVKAHALEFGPSAVLQEIGVRAGGSMEGDHPLVLQAQEARQRAGLPRAALGSSSSDANPFIDAGIPALTVGITTGRNAHQLYEEIDIGPIAAGTSALLELVELLLEPHSHVGH